MRMEASENICVQHATKIDVIDEDSLPGQKFIVFRPLNRCADELRDRTMGLLTHRLR